MASATTMSSMQEEDGGKKTTRKVVRVKQGYIDNLLVHPPKPFRGITKELLDEDTSERGDRLRAIMARAAAVVDKMYHKDADILKQYRLKGYAEEEIEITDASS